MTGSTAFGERFNSSIRFKVYVCGAPGMPDRLLGFTPASRSHWITKPEKSIWYVRPEGPLPGVGMQSLGKVLRAQAIPGLDLSDHWELTDHRFDHLADQPQLKYLNLERTPLTNLTLQRVGRWTQLSILYLGQEITDVGFAKLKNLVNLTQLSLDRTRISDRGLLILGRMPRLVQLDLSGTPITDDGIKQLSHLPQLKNLTLGGNVSNRSADVLAQLLTLETLDISETRLGESAMAAIASLPRLHVLIVNPQFSDLSLDKLSKLQALTTLDLSGSTITDDGLQSVVRFHHLQELALSDTQVTDAGVAALSKLPNLKIVELSNTRVTSSGVRQLARNLKLETLSFSWDKLSRTDVLNLSRLSHLRHLYLNGIPLSSDIMAQLKQLSLVPLIPQTAGDTDKVLGGNNALALQNHPSQADLSARSVIHPQPIGATQSAQETEEALAGPKLPAATLPPPKKSFHFFWRPAPSNEGVISGAGGPGTVRMDSPIVRSPEMDMQHLQSKSLPVGMVKSGSEVSSVNGDLARTPTAGRLAWVPSHQQEDNILKAIALRDKAVGHSPIPHLAGLRSTQETLPLSDVSMTGKAAIRLQEDRPENKIPDINVAAGN